MQALDPKPETSLTEEEMKAEIRRLAPFHHKIELPYGLSTHVPEVARRAVEATRISNLVNHAFPALLAACGGSLRGKRVLDVACNCGGFSVEAAKLGAEYVLAFDVVDHYIAQSTFIKRALKLDQVEFKLMSIDTLDAAAVGQFDVTLCLGILYHLENPISAMKRLSSVTKHAMLVDTDVVRTWFTRKPFWLMNMLPASTRESRDGTTSLWRSKEAAIQFRPTKSAVVELLKALGFQKVDTLEPESKDLEKRYRTGRRATFLAVRI